LELLDLLVCPTHNEKNWAIHIIKKVLGIDGYLFQHTKTIYSVHTVCLCVLYGSYNRQ